MESKDTKKYSYLDEYKIIKNLGSGYHAQVKLGMDPNGNLFAIKRYKKQTASLSTLEHELKIMKALQHQNLVKLYDVRENATYKNRDETTYKCFAIILEYVGGGELFDFIAETGRFSEKVARTYFHQLMNALYYMHCRGFVHRDIKPENILLSKDFTLKLADFGFACHIKGRDGSGILHTKLGTEGYMAPEIPAKNYKGSKTDIFAAGVILFIMYAGNPPFERAIPSDPYYKLIKQHNQGIFWKAHSRNRVPNFFNESFKDLFIKMVAYEPQNRPTIQEIANHPWIKGPVCVQSQLREEFELRKKRLDVVLEKKRLEQQMEKMAINNVETQLVSSRGQQKQLNEQLLTLFQSECTKQRNLQQLKQKNRDDFTVDQNIAYVVAVIKNFLNTKKIILEDEQQILTQNSMTLKLKLLEDSIDHLKVTYEYSMEVLRQEYNYELQINIKLGKTEDQKIAICPRLLSGNKLYYKKVVKQLKSLFLYCQN